MKTEPKKHDLVITRLFDAPVELVWKAWTEPEFVMQWWGPNYFTCPSAAIDFREGGTFVLFGFGIFLYRNIIEIWHV